jgi:DNA replication protein DnaC
MFKIDKLKLGRAAWIKVAGIPSSLIGWTLDDCTATDPQDIHTIRTWINAVGKNKIIKADGVRSSGQGLLLYGKPGHGKTTLAISIIQEMITTLPVSSFAPSKNMPLVRPCYFSTFNQVLDLKSSMMDGATDAEETLYYGMLGECENDAYNIRVLVIDDLGKEHAGLTGWQKNMFHHVLRTRVNNGLPTIVTTNIPLEGWAALYGDSTASYAVEAFGYMPIISTEGDMRK